MQRELIGIINELKGIRIFNGYNNKQHFNTGGPTSDLTNPRESHALGAIDRLGLGRSGKAWGWRARSPWLLSPTWALGSGLHLNLNVSMHIWIYTYMYTWIWIGMCVYVKNIYIYIYIHSVCIYIYIYIYIYWDRVLEGTLKSIDPYMNLQVLNTEEPAVVERISVAACFTDQ